jgi:CRP-like cAMP-binding protein
MAVAWRATSADVQCAGVSLPSIAPPAVQEPDTMPQPTINLFRNTQPTTEFPAKTVIFSEGDYVDEMYVIIEGEVKLIYHNGMTEYISPGGIFGELALIDSKPLIFTAVAETDCKLAAIDHKRFTLMVAEVPYFALHVMQVMAERLRLPYSQ